MRPDFAIFRVNHAMTPRQARWGGIVVLLLSAVSTTIATFLVAMVVEVPIPAHWLPAGTRFDGPRRTGPVWSTLLSGQGLAVMTAALIAIAGLLQGIWMTVLGRRNWALLRFMLLLLGLILVAGAVASLILGRRYGQVGQ